MEYVYAALILHESGREIEEATVTDILEAAGVEVAESRVKALVAALEDVDIEEAIQQPAVSTGAPAAEPADGDEAEAEGEEAEAEADEEEEDEDEEVSGEGLGELFG